MDGLGRLEFKKTTHLFHVLFLWWLKYKCNKILYTFIIKFQPQLSRNQTRIHLGMSSGRQYRMLQQWEIWKEMMESWEREPRHSDYAVAEHLNTLKQMSGFWNYVIKEEVGLHVLEPDIQGLWLTCWVWSRLMSYEWTTGTYSALECLWFICQLFIYHFIVSVTTTQSSCTMYKVLS